MLIVFKQSTSQGSWPSKVGSWESFVTLKCLNVSFDCYKQRSQSLPVTMQPLIVIGILVQSIYYSTQNGFIYYELSFPSGSWMYIHYFHHKFISKMAHFFGFKCIARRISTECDDWLSF